MISLFISGEVDVKSGTPDQGNGPQGESTPGSSKEDHSYVRPIPEVKRMFENQTLRKPL